MNDLYKAALAALDALENHTAIKHPQQRSYRDEAIEALRDALNRQHTHSDNCWSWGPAHYDCALRKIEQDINRRPMREEMIAQGRANCAFGGQELLGAFFQGWEAAERAHGIEK